MTIRDLLSRIFRRRNDVNASGILSSLGCYNSNQNGITPSMCNEGMLQTIISEMRRQGNHQTANNLEDWLLANKWRLQ